MADTNEKSAAETARHEGKTVGDEVRQKSAEAMQAAKDTAWSYAEKAREQAYARGEHYRDYAADETGKVASALRRASQDLSSGSPQERFVGQIADGVADAAERMRGMTLDDIARDTTEFARRHPAAFLGGAALLGFAAARFFKATAHEDDLYLPAAEGSAASAPTRAAPVPASEPIPPSTARPHSQPESTVPGGSSTTPGATSTTPGGSSTAPGGSGTTPGGSSTAPGASGTTPGGSSTTPGATSTSPGRPSTSPGGSSTTPGGSSTSPGRSGTTPGGTSNPRDGS